MKFSFERYRGAAARLLKERVEIPPFVATDLDGRQISTASLRGKLLLIERVMPARIDASAGHQRWTMLDMHMLVMLGGRERTEEEFRSVLAAANFELTRTLLLPGETGFSVIEATPI